MRTLLTVYLAIVTFYLQAQTIPDFYLPKKGINRSNYYSTGQDGRRLGPETSVWFVKKGDKYELFESYYINQEAATVTSKTMSISKNSLMVHTTTVTTSPFLTKTEKIHAPPQILLKLPEPGKYSTWSYTDFNGVSVYKCRAEIDSQIISGESQKVLKVTKKAYESGEFFSWASTIEHYVEGIGLWEKYTLDGKLLEKLDSQEHDSAFDF